MMSNSWMRITRRRAIFSEYSSASPVTVLRARANSRVVRSDRSKAAMLMTNSDALLFT